MPVPVTSPEEAAESDVRAAMHLPGATHNWAPRIPVTLPPATADREKWLARYAEALLRKIRPGTRTCLECQQEIPVQADGKFVMHALPGFPVECQGSGQPAYAPDDRGPSQA